MLSKKIINILRTSISDIIVVLLFLTITINVGIFFMQDVINDLVTTFNMVAIKNPPKETNVETETVNEETENIENPEETENVEVKIDEQTKRKHLSHYPGIGEKYGQLKINSIGVDLPLFFGDSLETLKYGIGHSSWSYFPGEGGSIVCMGHNYKTMLRNISNLKIGSIINITTNYGSYNYRVYDMQIIDENQMDATPIQQEKEILMLYTCYPFNNIGYTTQRYMVYAELQQ